MKINGAYIWDNVKIEDNCSIDTSVLCDNVVVYRSSNVSQGCILSWNVSICEMLYDYI